MAKIIDLSEELIICHHAHGIYLERPMKTSVDSETINPWKDNDSNDNKTENNDDNTPPVKPVVPVTTPTPKPTNTPTPQANAVTKTGTVTYNSPAGPEDVSFSVTVKNDIITAASSTPQAHDGMSKRMQNNFTNAVGSQVVGKSIKNLNLDAVGGASLTTKAFVKFVAASF